MFHNVVIDTPEAAQRLAEALEQAEQFSQKHNDDKCPSYKTLTGNEIKDFMSKVEIHTPENKLKIGDTVKMNNKYYVHEKYRDTEWKVVSNPWNLCGTDVVKLEGYSGGYAVDGLDIVKCS